MASSSEIQRPHKESEIEWEKALLVLLDMGHVWLQLPDSEPALINRDYKTRYIQYSLQSTIDFLLRLDSEGYEILIIQANYAASETIVSKILSRLIDMEFVNIIRDESGKCPLYILSPKGIDCALKLREHNDSKERYDQQKDINSIIAKNSTWSRWIAVGALICAAVLATSSTVNAAKILGLIC
ncbi:MAG: hypothetical protein GY714_01985 [Desulfobacterales bacterium]|nr:hypothetical protein [Desulfobacterales bacterium]